MRRTRWEIAEAEWRMERFAAEAVRCPRCGAEGRDTKDPADSCVNVVTDLELKAPAHPQRLTAAREAS